MRMLGIDEAGLGPTIGPFVVAAVGGEADWLARLAGVAEPKFDDSKRVYAGKDRSALERSAYAILRYALGRAPTDLAELPFVAAGDAFSGRIPRFAAAETLAQDDAALKAALGAMDARPLRLQIAALDVPQFNMRCQRTDSKAAVEAELIRSLLSAAPIAEFPQVACDRLGGRQFYTPLLAEWFPDAFAWTLEESQQTARYRVIATDWTSEFAFLVQGEGRELAIALASLVAKYVREVWMDDFNAAWRARIPDLEPTAGYPQDAKRFVQKLLEAGISDAEVTALLRER